MYCIYLYSFTYCMYVISLSEKLCFAIAQFEMHMYIHLDIVHGTPDS